MNRPLTALFAALEALLVVAIGVAIPLVPLTVLWAFQYGLQINWIVFWRAAVDVWLLGSGVDVTMTLNPVLATGLGFANAGTPFILTIAPLGFALLTVLLGVRAGRRIGETPFRGVGIAVAIATFAVLSLGVTLSALFAAARASIWQGTLLPTLVFAVGIVIGLAVDKVRPEATLLTASTAPADPIRRLSAALSAEQRAIAITAARGGAATAAAIVAASAITVVALLLGNYASIVTLYEAVHAGVLGGISLTVGQIAFLPNLVIWAASWFVGPGFAIGTGSAVSPLGTTLGPIPAVPILGALPHAGVLDWGFLGLLVPVLAGFAIALVVRPRLVRDLGPSAGTRAFIVTGLLIGVVGGIVLGLLAWASSGSAGPGRLVDVGPSPWLVGLFGALEIGVAAAIGLIAGRPWRGDRVSAAR
jgi:hypothetical protein